MKLEGSIDGIDGDAAVVRRRRPDQIQTPFAGDIIPFPPRKPVDPDLPATGGENDRAYLGCVYPVSTVDRPQRTRRNDALTRKNIAKLLLGRVDIVVCRR